MTIYNLKGVQQAQKLGFKRCVLARELSIEEIKNICKNTDLEIEVFIHGALCICYSGQCLMSSIIGGRSGNRGKCAGTCRLPYSLMKNGQVVDKGYLLSSKDVCTLDILPELISAGVKSFKIEGRMKSPEYVGLVTSIYRKYIDLANSNKTYIVEDNDREKLMQIFNRGGFSTGYLNGKLGKEMMYKFRPNHIGIYIGEVINYNKNKGYIKFKLEKELCIGDSIAVRDDSCKVSELMIGNNNIKIGEVGQVVTIGRIYGNIKQGEKIYKTVSTDLNRQVDEINKKENIKRLIDCKIIIKENKPIILTLSDRITGITVKQQGIIPEKAQKTGLTEERIKEQLSKLGNTVFKIEHFDIELDNMLITSISGINELRRITIQELESKIKESFYRKAYPEKLDVIETNNDQEEQIPTISLCLNNVNSILEYEKLEDIDRIYIPLRFFSKYKENIKKLSMKFNTYILMPTISKGNYDKIDIHKIIDEYNIKGIVISNLSQIEEFKGMNLISNYTMNIFNDYTALELKNMGLNMYTISPEADKETIRGLGNNLLRELIVYGRTRLMISEYCTIGTYRNCNGVCENGEYKLKDRMGFEFPIYTDRTNCNNIIYNSKVTSIEWSEFKPDSIRIDILNEDIDEINKIIKTHKNGKRLEGQMYTSGNLNKTI